MVRFTDRGEGSKTYGSHFLEAVTGHWIERSRSPIRVTHRRAAPKRSGLDASGRFKGTLSSPHVLPLTIRILSSRLLNEVAARIIDLRSEPAVGADLSAPSLRRYSQAIRAQRVERSLNPANPWLDP